MDDVIDMDDPQEKWDALYAAVERVEVEVETLPAAPRSVSVELGGATWEEAALEVAWLGLGPFDVPCR